MDNEFWTPKFEDGESVMGSEKMAMATSSNTLQAASTPKQQPAMIMPAVGDKMRFIVYPYGQLQLIDNHMSMQDKQNVIEVEVMALKKTHVSYE